MALRISCGSSYAFTYQIVYTRRALEPGQFPLLDLHSLELVLEINSLQFLPLGLDQQLLFGVGPLKCRDLVVKNLLVGADFVVEPLELIIKF